MKRRAAKALAKIKPPALLAVNAYISFDKLKVLRRETDGSLVATTLPLEYVFFVKKSDEHHLESLKGKRKIVASGDFLRVACKSYDERERLCRGFKDEYDIYHEGYIDKGVVVFEADLNPIKRWMIDSGVQIQEPISGYMDLESDSRVPFAEKGRARMLCWGLCVYRNGELERLGGVLEKDTDACERELIKDLFYELASVDQILAWNGEAFDFEYLKERIAYLGLPIDMRRWLLCDHMLLYQKFNMVASESGDEKASMALNRVAQSLKVAGKLKEKGVGELAGVDVGGAKTWEFWKSGGRNRELLLEYCVEDAATMYRIEQANAYVETLTTLAQTCGVFPDSYGMKGKAFVESFIMRLAAEDNQRSPTKYHDENEVHEKFKGAFVFDTVRGLFENVHVCDFARLYPSIMQAWNMSPETYIGKEHNIDQDRFDKHVGFEGETICPITHEKFTLEKGRGLFARALDLIVEQRKVWSKKKAGLVPKSPEWLDADRRDQAYKIIANTFYGVSGSPYSRFFMKELSESVTQVGQWLIKETVKEAEKRGYKLVAGDTDSAMIRGCTVDEFAEFVKWCNDFLYKKLITPTGADPKFISLAFEKSFSLMGNIEKKTYFGRILHFKGQYATIDTSPVVKGLEYKRGDTAKLARELQEEFINEILMVGKEIPSTYNVSPELLTSIAQRWQHRIMNGDFEFADAVIAKKIQKPIGGYGGMNAKGTQVTVPAHVQVAKVLQGRGFPIYPGIKVEYVVTDGKASPMKVKPAMDAKKEDLDLFHLWETVVWPAAERVLVTCFPNTNWKYYGAVRPISKGRKKVLPGQLGMGLGERKPLPPVRETNRES